MSMDRATLRQFGQGGMITSYGCKHCGERFATSVKLGGHVHAAHPEHRRPVVVSRRAIPARGPSGRPSLKRDTDTWPGKP